MPHFDNYFAQVEEIAQKIDRDALEQITAGLAALRETGGRLFILGVGGSAANCSHAVNDFRKLCGIEAYSPVDNVAELTARTNDEGWDTVFAAWLRTSKANAKDAILVFSVGGGNAEKNVSANIVRALDEAKSRGLKIYGVVGRDGGYTKKVGDAVVVVPTVHAGFITPHTEAFQAVVWHAIVCHPSLQMQANKWEGLSRP
jgi:D-sedoheptulose 7-phosphate isomerase